MGLLEAVAPIKSLLDGASTETIRAMGVASLRAWRRRSPAATEFSIDVLYEIADQLAEGKQVTGNLHEACRNAYMNSREFSWMSPLVEFPWWMVRAGFAIPLGVGVRDLPLHFRLTRSGLRFLEQSDDHPLLPGAIERTAQRCTGLPSEVANLLGQARACMDHGLLRPGVVIMGVAYEIAMEAIVDSMVTRNHLPNGAADEPNLRRIDRVRNQIDTVLGAASRDDRETVRRAYDFAHELRRRRNDAAHSTPTYGFDDTAETEEFLTSALHHLPHLWRMYA